MDKSTLRSSIQIMLWLILFNNLLMYYLMWIRISRYVLCLRHSLLVFSTSYFFGCLENNFFFLKRGSRTRFLWWGSSYCKIRIQSNGGGCLLEPLFLSLSLLFITKTIFPLMLVRVVTHCIIPISNQGNTSKLCIHSPLSQYFFFPFLHFPLNQEKFHLQEKKVKRNFFSFMKTK